MRVRRADKRAHSVGHAAGADFGDADCGRPAYALAADAQRGLGVARAARRPGLTLSGSDRRTRTLARHGHVEHAGKQESEQQEGRHLVDDVEERRKELA